MTEPWDPVEQWRRLEALELVQLASENIPPLGTGGIFPEPGSGWYLIVIEQPRTGAKSNWYVTDLARQMLEEPNVSVFDEGIDQIGQINRGALGLPQRTRVKGALSVTIFLPLMVLLWVLRFPARPGSPYTIGQAFLGFGAVLALVGAVVALFQRNWLLLGLSVYWWVGAKVIESEARARGYLV